VEFPGERRVVLGEGVMLTRFGGHL
jgi:hypothetical protein